MLDIRSPLKKQALKHNVIDRDKVLVPPNWDSWGKIRVLREGFDVEGTSSEWSIYIQRPEPSSVNDSKDTDGTDPTTMISQPTNSSPEGAVLSNYESTITNPQSTKPNPQSAQTPQIEVSVKPTQEFLAAQLETITRLQAEDEKAASKTPNSTNPSSFNNSNNKTSDDRVNEHIGPVQVNMGGIQVDADDMVKRLKNRERELSNKTSSSS